MAQQVVHINNRELSRSAVTIGGYGTEKVPFLYDPALEPDEWCVFEDDECVSSPRPFEDVKKVRAVLRQLRGLPPIKDVEPPPTEPRGSVKVPTVTLDKITAAIMGMQGKTIENLAEIGRLLIEAKRFAGHGNWLSYLEERVDMSARNAELYMRLYRKLGSNSQTYANLTVSKVLLLLDAPDAERDRLIDVARTSTTKVLRREIKEAVEQAGALPAPHIEVRDITPPPAPAPVESTPSATPSEDSPEPLTTPREDLDPQPLASPLEQPSEPAEDADTGMESEAPEEPRETAEEPAPLVPPEAPEPPKEPALPARPESKKKTPEVEILPPLPDPHKHLKEEAHKVDRSIGALLDAVKKHGPVISSASATDIGEWVDLKAMALLSKGLQGLTSLLEGLEAACTRQWEQSGRRKTGTDGN